MTISTENPRAYQIEPSAKSRDGKWRVFIESHIYHFENTKKWCSQNATEYYVFQNVVIFTHHSDALMFYLTFRSNSTN